MATIGPGLSDATVQARLAEDGFNEIPRPERRTPFRIVLEVVREPMLALLLAGGVVYLVLGSLQEALILLAFATFSILVTVVQESRTERVLEALRDLTSPRALVIRGGEQRRIAGREVVRGDLLVLGEGDRVPADAVLLDSQDLHTDESLLTGESVPVRKVAAPAPSASTPAPRPGGDDLPYVFSGSLIVRGTAVGEVAATGARSEIGRIGQSLNSLEAEAPRLQTEIRRLVRVFAVIGGSVSVLAVLLYGFLRSGWLDALLGGIALGMSMLPEELPVVLTVFMAMGAWRISRARVLTRRASAIEALGAATVLCTDKTGTLTENRMTVAELCLPSGASFRPATGTSTEVAAPFQELLGTAVRASAPEPVDPMERAIHALGTGPAGISPPSATGDTVVRSYGLRPELLAMSQVWQPAGGAASLAVAAKGAPEAIFGLCRLDVQARAAMTAAVEAMAARGLRVLGVAGATMDGRDLPESQAGFAFRFSGLVGLADPLRASAADAVRECQSAGIRVVMITGDYPATALAIAQEVGLDTGHAVVSGGDLSALDDAQLRERVRTATVFARIMPEQKLRIVSALKANGEVVAMTGDGVNDAPSLKAAHIGIAMGGRGTDVAREASALVLLDDDFGSIVAAVRLGRRIYDNLRKAMAFIVAVHVPIAGLALLPLVLGLPVLFGPMHIAFLEMVIDPVCSMVFEAERAEANVMRRPPRAPDEPIFSAAMVGWSLLQGALALVLVGTIFVVATHRGMPDTEVRALTFFSLVFAIVALIFVNRSFSASLTAAFRLSNPALAWVLLVVTGMLTLTLRWPLASRLFRFGPLHADDLLLVLGAGVLVLGVLERLKPLWQARLKDAARTASL